MNRFSFSLSSSILLFGLIFFQLNFIPAQQLNSNKSDKGETQSNSSGAFVFHVNNIILPMNNRGVIGDVSIPPYPAGGYFQGKSFLFSSGFFMSGYTDTTLWANAVATASRIQDYLAGPVGANPSDPKNIIYVVDRIDPPFSTSWQDWSDAVNQGAYFYDGDNDGIYNPVDKNSNGIWDLSEDMPDILGDRTAWCVYNDGVPDSLRRYNKVKPQGIEIRQTMFATNRIPQLSNVVFIRYTIVNKGTVKSVLDSVYFSAWADIDLGDYTDDLTGCDTLLSSGYTYNDSSDGNYGMDPPAIFFNLIQGPKIYTGSNIDTAFNMKGFNRGKESQIGYKNLWMTSFWNYVKHQTTNGEPQTQLIANYYMKGYSSAGNLINPCTWFMGKVSGGVDCNNVNSKFMYSGDPVTNIGWINSGTDDQRMMVNTGPFKLETGKPQDIIIAYTVGRGTDALNSISVARNITNYVFQEYRSNFGTITGVDDFSGPVIKNFSLSQNYPNPFNPETRIQYSVVSPPAGEAGRQHVTLRVFDILGREVATLVDEVKDAGIHHLPFSIVHFPLPSGVYFYQLRAGNFVETKKMVVIK
ncbi:MAG: T9SS type A sorting domain-containing protein [Bacteroidetes bacterium]|nr:T9SS type A sorting domain-containing protein [Bacteroidota bacterium]MBU2585054.1 T9SS type A sorting domain-containing protein [Bacteroidota bacterium]